MQEMTTEDYHNYYTMFKKSSLIYKVDFFNKRISELSEKSSMGSSEDRLMHATKIRKLVHEEYLWCMNQNLENMNSEWRYMLTDMRVILNRILNRYDNLVRSLNISQSKLLG
jgi:hypothetical protein